MSFFISGLIGDDVKVLNTKNLVLGSTIVKRISTDIFSEKVPIHAYPGSKTENKNEIVEKYKILTPLVSLVLQDATNKSLKEKGNQLNKLSRGNKVLLLYHNKLFNLSNFHV